MKNSHNGMIQAMKMNFTVKNAKNGGLLMNHVIAKVVLYNIAIIVLKVDVVMNVTTGVVTNVLQFVMIVVNQSAITAKHHVVIVINPTVYPV